MTPSKPYDPTGAMGGLFAPAYIHGDPAAEAATQKWMAENYSMTNPGVEATRGPSTTVTNPALGGMGQAIRGAGTTETIPGMVDPEALRVLAQGGKYKDTRNAIAAQVLANQGGAAAPAQPSGGTGGVGGAGGLRSAEYPGMLPIGFNTMTPEQQARYGSQGFMGGGMGGYNV